MSLSGSFVEEVLELIRSARTSIARGVNLIQVHTNFEIGRRIVEHEQQGKDRAGYGQEVLRGLSARLTVEFGSGFSQRNLELMRRFYSLYGDRIPEIPQTLSAELGGSNAQTLSGKLPTSIEFTYRPQPRPFSLSWSHYVFLLAIKNVDERSFYEIESTEQNWTLRELKRQFDSGLYERLALSRDKEGIRRLAHEGQIVSQPADLLKEPLVLEFLGLSEQARYSESDLESAIITQIERFLLELGKGFLFEARQKRFTFDEDHFFVDLVFYNRLLRCYVLIDLKIGKLTHKEELQRKLVEWAETTSGD
jgi:predicted nuclease of restriction endonuclease-like (RecB) superfamily